VVGAGLRGDVYRAPGSGCLAVFFHASNGSRSDLTQLAWHTAQRGLDAATVTWMDRRQAAYPGAFQAMQRLICELADRRPTVFVAWADSSLVVLTSIGWAGADTALTLEDCGVVAIAGVYGWRDSVPPNVAGSSRACAFFGGPPAVSDGWTQATPWATIDRWPECVHLTSIAPSPPVENALDYHRALQSRGVTVRMLERNRPNLDLISPRHPTGRAVAEVVLAEGRRLAAAG
jgi:hypothetical protein